MELKTKIDAEPNAQDLWITREFDLPLNLLFLAYKEPEIVAQWMGTKVLKLENYNHGSYHFETTDPMGNTHDFAGCIHEFIENKGIVRTFEMLNTPFPAQMEYLEFEAITHVTSRLKMHVVYKSVEVRDQILKLPFKQGINMAHNRIQEIVGKLINN